MKGELLIWFGRVGGGHRFVLSVEVAFYHPGGVGAVQWCSVFTSVNEQESAEVSREIRVPWSHLAAVPASFSYHPQLRKKTVKNSKCMLAMSLFSCCEHTKNVFIFVHVSSSHLVVF